MDICKVTNLPHRMMILRSSRNVYQRHASHNDPSYQISKTYVYPHVIHMFALIAGMLV